MKINKILISLVVMLLVFGTTFAAAPTYSIEHTYVAEEAGKPKNVLVQISFFDENGNVVETFVAPKAIFSDTQFAKTTSKKELTLEFMENIKQTIDKYFIEKCKTLLNTEVTVFRGANQMTTKAKLSSYIPDSKSDAAKRSEELAYNINHIKETLEKHLSNDTFTNLQFTLIDLSKINDTAGFASNYGTDFPNYYNSTGKEIEDEYLLMLNDINLYFVDIDSKMTTLNNAIKLTGLEVSESNKSEAQQPSVSADYDGTAWWEAAQNFFKKAEQSGSNSEAVNSLVDNLSSIIFNVGNMIFIIVTSVLGVKYIFDSAEGKAKIKDSLISLVVAALFFYGWSAISTLLDIGGLFATGTLESAAQKLYNTILFIVNFLAIGGIVWIGIKYMLSSAEGKAQIKTSWLPLILGVIMVYATVWFLSQIITIVLA